MLRLRRGLQRVREDSPSIVAVGVEGGDAAVPQELDTIVRDFDDPYLELVRLLHEAAEIEHALLVQYLYAALSVTDQYRLVRGNPQRANAEDLVGVAVWEMQHLATVNKLLVTLGASPGLTSQDFPYEPDIYPFPLNLEPMSQHSLAKYVFAEARAGKLDPANPSNAGERPFLELLFRFLGQTRPNHLGSLYGTIIAVVRQLSQAPGSPLPNPDQWVESLEAIRDDGEDDHFRFFKKVFLGAHEAFNGVQVWSFSPDDPRYPALPLPVNPSAFEGHPNQILNEQARQTAWLGNLQYWIVLILLDLSYRRNDGSRFLGPAKRHMKEPLWRLGRHLATMAAGLPFDPLSMGYAPGSDTDATLKFLRHLLEEAERHTTALRATLPADYPFNSNQKTLEFLGTMGVA